MKAKLRQRPVAQAAVQRRPVSEKRVREPGPANKDLQVIAGGLDASAIFRLQATAGNEAVGQLLAQRAEAPAGRPVLSVQSQAAACPPAPPPPAPVSPHEDPRFTSVTSKVQHQATKEKRHPAPKAKVSEAQGAAVPPTNEVLSKAAASQVDDMSEKKPKGFDKAAFIAAVKEAIERATPKNMDEVDEMAKSDKAAAVKGEVSGKVAANKELAAKDIKESSAAAPDTSKVASKPPTPMKPETPGAPPADVGARRAMPAEIPAEQTSLDHTKCETDSQMAEAGVSDEQVQNSNEPEFHEALDAKKKADEHAATAPQQFRQGEQQALSQAQSGAAVSAATGLTEAHATRATTGRHVSTHKDQAKSKNETERANLAKDLETIYNTTKKEVDDILGGLDKKVSDSFDSGEKEAREAFNTYYRTKKDAFFEDRYDRFGGSVLWLKDQWLSPPARVNEFIVEAKDLYVSRMEQVINRVATLVETELNRATARIQEGRKQIQAKVEAAPKALQQFAAEAASNFESRFDELDQAVEGKASGIVDDLAQKYVAASKEVEELCNQMREENKGLLERAKDAIAGMIETIKKLAAMLADVAARAASVVGRIIKHPIDFFGKLVDAVQTGFNRFVHNIGAHLEEGLMDWLFGELRDTGVTMPESFDLKGILQLVLQVLGVSWVSIRTRAVAVLGDPIVAMIEKGHEAFQKVMHIFEVLKTEGLAGLWGMVQEQIGDLQALVIDQIKDFVITKVITAGVTWILSMLNPASAFIKACKGIYDVIMFFVERGSQIIELINAIIDNLGAILDGNLDAAAAKVEEVMAKGLSLAISFLASLLGLGGITEKIKQIITAIRAPIGRAIDWLLKTVVKPVAKVAMKAVGWVGGKVAAGKAWVKGKYEKGKAWVKTRAKAGVAWVKGKAQQGKAWAKKGVTSVKERLLGKQQPKPTGRTPKERARDLEHALGTADALIGNQSLSIAKIRKRLPPIQSKYGLSSLELAVDKKDKERESLHVIGSMSPPRPTAVRQRDYTGEAATVLVITSDLKIPRPKRRLGFERDLPSRGEYAPGTFEDAERAHAMGRITGPEAREGIRLATRYVNQVLQAKGIEKMIQALGDRLRDDPTYKALPYKTVVRTVAGTLRLQSIEYVLDAMVPGESRPRKVLQVSIALDWGEGEAKGRAKTNVSIDYVGSVFTEMLVGVAEEVPEFQDRLEAETA